MPPPEAERAHDAGIGRYAAASAIFAWALVAPACTIDGVRGAETGDGKALFTRMVSVLTSPRCLNCHTNTGFPRQGDDRHLHLFNAQRGPEDTGMPVMHCAMCHQSANQAASGVPGAPHWRLAPLSMAWEGLSPAALCRALFDPEHGKMAPEGLVEHLRSEPLVSWAWAPGRDRQGRERARPPIAHDAFVDLAAQWVAAGAPCPE